MMLWAAVVGENVTGMSWSPSLYLKGKSDSAWTLFRTLYLLLKGMGGFFLLLWRGRKQWVASEPKDSWSTTNAEIVQKEGKTVDPWKQKEAFVKRIIDHGVCEREEAALLSKVIIKDFT